MKFAAGHQANVPGPWSNVRHLNDTGVVDSRRSNLMLLAVR
jgi:hypothetical protein